MEIGTSEAIENRCWLGAQLILVGLGHIKSQLGGNVQFTFIYVTSPFSEFILYLFKHLLFSF